MNVVDSCGWLEYLADGKNAEKFEGPLKHFQKLIVPTVCLFEVYKVMQRELGKKAALSAAARMRQANVVDLNHEIALQAAINSHKLKLPMADSIIYTTAQLKEAILWTQDEHFDGLAGVKFFNKK
jgi:predicted nucleic acid-binding protein